MSAAALTRRGLPHPVRKKAGQFDPSYDSINVMSLNSSKGLEIFVMALVCAGRMPVEGEAEREEARLFYVWATRAPQRLVIGASGLGSFSTRFGDD